jgi:hypothetical protein
MIQIATAFLKDKILIEREDSDVYVRLFRVTHPFHIFLTPLSEIFAGYFKDSFGSHKRFRNG